MPAACHLLPPELSLLALQRRVTMEALVRSYLDSIGGGGGIVLFIDKGRPSPLWAALYFWAGGPGLRM